MKVIGLTGSIASGKSTVASMLKNAKIKVIDADELARRVSAQGGASYQQIATRFGPGILKNDGSLDRQALANIVFNDIQALADLEKIIHPAIESLRQEELKAAKAQGHQVVVYMAPLLFEKNLEKEVDKTLLVVASKELQIKRMRERDGLNQDDAQKRLDHQMSAEEKMAKADEIIVNNGTIDELFRELEGAWERLGNAKLAKY